MSEINPPPAYSLFMNIYPDKMDKGRVVFAINCEVDYNTGKPTYLIFPAAAAEDEFEEITI